MKNPLLLLLTSCLLLLQSQAQTTTVQVGDLIENTMVSGFTAPLYRIGNPSTSQQLYSRHFFVYPLEDLCKAGLRPGATISKLQWFKGAQGSLSGITHKFKVYIKNSNIISRNGDTWTNLITGATKVFESDVFVITTVGGWFEIEFTNPFIYNGDGIEIYTDWFADGTPNQSITTGLISFGQTTRSGGIDNIRLAGGSAKFTPFTDDEFVGGGIFTTNVTSNMLNLKLIQTGGTLPCPTQYASKQTGPWNFTTTWQRLKQDGTSTFVAATRLPDVADQFVQIIGNTTVTVNSAITTDELIINNLGKLKMDATGFMTLNNGAGTDLTNNGTLEMVAGAEISGLGNFVNSNTANITAATINVPITNNFLLTFNGNCTASNPNTNNNLIQWLSGGMISGPLNNTASGVFQIASDNSWGNGNITNAGSIVKTSAGTTTMAGMVFNTGLITVKGVLEIAGASTSSGTISGVGTINFSGGITNTGNVLPNGVAGIGQLNFNSFGQPLSNTSVVQIEISGTGGAGIGNDLLSRDGSLTLTGKLVVNELSNVPGGAYEIIRCNTGLLSGSFAQVSLPLGYTLLQTSTSLFVVKPGGFVSYPGSGNGIGFDGDNDIASVPHNSTFNFTLTQNFTIDFWVRVPVANQTDVSFTNNTLIEKWGIGNAFGAHPFSVSIGNSTSGAANGKIIFSRQNGSAVSNYYSLTSTIAVNDGRYHHIVAQKEGSILRILIDGIERGTLADKTTGATTNNSPLVLGSSSDLGSSFKGDIDEVRIWNTAVSSTLIRTWMCKKLTNAHPNFANLVAYYPLDHTEGSSFFIDFKSTNHGSLGNGANFGLSGASIGDESAFDYSSLPSTFLPLAGGEKFAATSQPGNLLGIHVYVVQATPNSVNGIAGVGGNNRYFGVHPVGSTAPMYDAVYEYSGNPFIVSEGSLHLFKRNSNDVNAWVTANAVLNTANHSFTFTGTFTEYMLGSIGTSLPVTLISFTGSKHNNDARLQWKTANERGITQFEIQRSSDGQSFATIGSVAAGGSLYTYTDTNIFISRAVAFYRLKSIDADGKFIYSAIVQLSGASKGSITIYPNPVADVLSISGLQQKGTLKLFTADGKLVQQQAITAQSITLNMGGYAKGTYLLQYIADGKVANEKIVKQ